MASEVTIDPSEFEEFFEASFSSETKEDFAKFYPRIKKLLFRNLKCQGILLFEIFLSRLGFSDFELYSAEGQETLSLLQECLQKDKTVIPQWPKLISHYPEETASVLNHLRSNIKNINFVQQLKLHILQSHELALTSVKHLNLLQAAKGFLIAAEKQRRYNRRQLFRKMGIYVLLFSIVGLLWLDVAENGKGSFSRSHVGQLLSSYDVLDNFLWVWEHVSFILQILTTHIFPLVQHGFSGLQPLFSLIYDMLQFYIPDVVGLAKSFLDTSATGFSTLGNKVFVGSLSPENLRHMTKEALSFLWTNVFHLLAKIVQFAAQLLEASRQ